MHRRPHALANLENQMIIPNIETRGLERGIGRHRLVQQLSFQKGSLGKNFRHGHGQILLLDIVLHAEPAWSKRMCSKNPP